MAVVETYLSQLQYTNTVNDLKEDLDRRNAHDLDSSSSDEGARVQVHATHKKPQGQPWRMPAQEKGLHQRHHGKALRKRPQAKHAARLDDWLSQQDFGRTFTHKSGALDPQAGPDGQAPNPLRPAYTRHHILRLAKGTAWDRIMGALSWLNKTLPIYLPTSPGRRWWEVFIMLLVLYNAAAVPLDISFGMPSTGRIVTYLEYAVDLIFAADICGNFRAAYIDHMGYLIRDTGQIAANYLKFWFWIDLTATIPYDLLAMAVLRGEPTQQQLIILGFLRTPRLLRLGRLVRMLDRLKGGNGIRVFVLICTMVFLAHWLACIWYMLYRFTTFADYTEWGMFVGGLISEEAKLSAYISAYYQSFLLLVGNNQPSHNNLERVFMVLVLILGAIFYSAVVGQMAVLVATMNTVGLRHRTKEDQTMDVLRYIGLPDSQKARVQAYFTYVTQFNHPGNEGLAFLHDLPKALFEELTGFLYRKHLEKIPLFSNLEPAFLVSVALRMRIVTFTPRETIFSAGDLGLEMYIIRKGNVAVVGKQSQLMGLLGQGDYFGEIALFTQAKRTAKCVALSNCDLCVLNSMDLKMVMKDFPTSAQTLQDQAKEKLRQLQVAGRAGFAQEQGGEEEEDEQLKPPQAPAAKVPTAPPATQSRRSTSLPGVNPAQPWQQPTPPLPAATPSPGLGRRQGSGPRSPKLQQPPSPLAAQPAWVSCRSSNPSRRGAGSPAPQVHLATCRSYTPSSPAPGPHPASLQGLRSSLKQPHAQPQQPQQPHQQQQQQLPDPRLATAFPDPRLPYGASSGNRLQGGGGGPVGEGCEIHAHLVSSQQSQPGYPLGSTHRAGRKPADWAAPNPNPTSAPLSPHQTWRHWSSPQPPSQPSAREPVHTCPPQFILFPPPPAPSPPRPLSAGQRHQWGVGRGSGGEALGEGVEAGRTSTGWSSPVPDQLLDAYASGCSAGPPTAPLTTQASSPQGQAAPPGGSRAEGGQGAARSSALKASRSHRWHSAATDPEDPDASMAVAASPGVGASRQALGAAAHPSRTAHWRLAADQDGDDPGLLTSWMRAAVTRKGSKAVRAGLHSVVTPASLVAQQLQIDGPACLMPAKYAPAPPPSHPQREGEERVWVRSTTMKHGSRLVTAGVHSVLSPASSTAAELMIDGPACLMPSKRMLGTKTSDTMPKVEGEQPQPLPQPPPASGAVAKAGNQGLNRTRSTTPPATSLPAMLQVQGPACLLPSKRLSVTRTSDIMGKEVDEEVAGSSPAWMRATLSKQGSRLLAAGSILPVRPSASGIRPDLVIEGPACLTPLALAAANSSSQGSQLRRSLSRTCSTSHDLTVGRPPRVPPHPALAHTSSASSAANSAEYSVHHTTSARRSSRFSYPGQVQGARESDPAAAAAAATGDAAGVLVHGDQAGGARPDPILRAPSNASNHASLTRSRRVSVDPQPLPDIQSPGARLPAQPRLPATQTPFSRRVRRTSVIALAAADMELMAQRAVKEPPSPMMRVKPAGRHESRQFDRQVTLRDGSTTLREQQLMQAVAAAEGEASRAQAELSKATADLGMVRADLDVANARILKAEAEAQADKALKVQMFKQVQLLLRALGSLGQQVGGLEERVADLEVQLTRLEASNLGDDMLGGAADFLKTSTMPPNPRATAALTGAGAGSLAALPSWRHPGGGSMSSVQGAAGAAQGQGDTATATMGHMAGSLAAVGRLKRMARKVQARPGAVGEQ